MGERNNPGCDDNIAALVERWHAGGRPVVHVRHDEIDDPSSPLHPDSPGNRLKHYLATPPDLLVTKHVNSGFHGSPDLQGWLTAHNVPGIVVCGITTNHCCETTARVGGNLGYDVLFAIDATHTFDRAGPDGQTMTADELTRATYSRPCRYPRPTAARGRHYRDRLEEHLRRAAIWGQHDPAAARMARHSGLLEDSRQDRVWPDSVQVLLRVRSLLGCPPVCGWLTFGLRPAGRRDGAWLKKGLLCSW